MSPNVRTDPYNAWLDTTSRVVTAMVGESVKREVNMSRNLQPIIAAASLICGLTLMALVFSIQREPLAWTEAPERAALSPAPTSVPKDEQRKDVLESNM